MNDGFGPTQLGLLNQSDQLGCSLKTHLISCCMALSGLSLRWKLLGTTSSRKERTGRLRLCASVLGRSVPRTKGIGCGSLEGDWKTPQKHDEREQGKNRPIWPTPRTITGGPESAKRKKELGRMNSGGSDLQAEVLENWPTVHGNLGNNGPSGTELGFAVGQAGRENRSTNGKPRGSLNSAWVAQLMGWPEEYVAELTKACCEYSATAGSTKSR